MRWSLNYDRRLWLALYLGVWSHHWLLTHEEILSYNDHNYDLWRSTRGLP